MSDTSIPPWYKQFWPWFLLPRGLIRYTTENALEGKKSHILRPRLIGYFVALVVMMATFAWAVNDRTPMSFDAERERTQLYQMTRDGQISNVYSLTVRNLDSQDHTYDISAAGCRRCFGGDDSDFCLGS